MHAPHTTCPGCQEEVFLDELVGGKCPLCGCSLEDFEESIGEYDGILDRSDLSWLIFNYFVFKKFVDLGVPPSQIMDFLSTYEQNTEKPREEGMKTEFSLDLPMGILDTIRPKRCAKCNRLFIWDGRKQITGDTNSTMVKIQYICNRC
jgi:hypothetical protein